MKLNMLDLIPALIFEYDGKLGIQVCGFMHAALDIIFLEPGLVKNRADQAGN